MSERVVKRWVRALRQGETIRLISGRARVWRLTPQGGEVLDLIPGEEVPMVQVHSETKLDPNQKVSNFWTGEPAYPDSVLDPPAVQALTSVRKYVVNSFAALKKDWPKRDMHYHFFISQKAEVDLLGGAEGWSISLEGGILLASQPIAVSASNEVFRFPFETKTVPNFKNGLDYQLDVWCRNQFLPEIRKVTTG